MSQREVDLTLTADEALVLFEWASRFTDDDSIEFQHPAERAAIWGLTASLERILVEPFAPDYHELLAAARNRVAERAGVNDDS